MPAQYSVVQLLPDPATGERMNIGVVVWDGDKIRAKFTTDVRRVKAFTPVGVDLLRTFSAKFKAATADQLDFVDASQRITPKRLVEMISTWEHMLQLTPPRGSVKGADALLNEIAQIFLPTRKVERHEQHRARRRAIKAAVTQMSLSLQTVLGEGADNEYLKQDTEVQGSLDKHRVDVALGNGKLFAAINAISFETEDQERLENEIGAAAWTFKDVGEKNKALKRALFYLEPQAEGSPAYSHAKRLFKMLNVDFVPESKFQSWTKRQAKALVHE